MRFKLTCAGRDAILHEVGRYNGCSVYSGFTDMDGTYGDPAWETTWEKDGKLIRDVRHPSGNRDDGPDRKPCEHYDLGTVAEHEGIEDDED